MLEKVTINIRFVCDQARLHAQGKCNGDECLYRIGREAQLLDEKDINQMCGGKLSCSSRSRVLTWLRRNANTIGLTK